MAWGYTYRASWAPLALFSQVWLVSDCEIVCGKRFGNQWFWQVGALLVALQVYNHSFRSSVPRLGNRSFLSVPALYSTPSLSRLSDCCVEDWNWNLRDKSKSPSSSSFSSPISIKMTVLMNIPLKELYYPVSLEEWDMILEFLFLQEHFIIYLCCGRSSKWRSKVNFGRGVGSI